MKRLQSLSYKTLFTILFFALAGIIFFLKIGGKTQKVSAAWWDDLWHYRKSIIVTNNTSFDAANIPYKITLDTQDLISTGKLQADADDIRIVDSNGNIIRSQVEKSTLNTAVTKIWFEATVKSNTTASYYIYYGNPSASSPNFETDIQSFSNTSTTTTIQMKDGFGYTTSSTNGGRVTDIRKNSTDLGVDGNINNSGSYPGGWWGTIPQTILNSTGPLFVEIVYGAGATGSYSAYESNIKVFDNGFAETRLFVTYNASGSENFYYYLAFATGTRNSVWINGSGTLVDQDADSGNLTEASLGQNWFGQRWTASGNYGGTIITKNNSDWVNGGTSTRASYYQTNYAYSKSFTAGSTRELRYAVFAGDGGLSEMTQKGANYGALGSTINNEEIGTAPIAYWKFDEGSGTTAYDSAGTNNGSISSATYISEDQCVSGKCLNYTGSAYVNLGNPANFRIQNNSVTIETWVNFDSLDYVNNTGKLIGFTGKGAPDTAPGVASSGFWFSYDNRNNRNSFTYTCFGNSAGGYSGGGNNFGGYNYTFNTNTWYHLAVTISNNEGRLYINGKQIGAAKTFSGLQLNNISDNLYLGRTSAGYHIGSQDEVKIYPYARTADQIKQDYNSRGSVNSSSTNLGIKSNTAPPLKSKLVAYYKFDENNGTIAYDSSGSNKNGSLSTGSSSPTWSNNGRFNKALSFDGNDSITLSNEIVSTSSIRINGITYSAWIKPTTISGTQKIFGQKPSSGYADLASGGLDISSGKARMIAYDDNIAYKYATGNTTLSSNQWYLITGVYDPSDQKIKIYVNGKFDGGETSITTFNRLISNDYNLIGSHNFSSSFFNGLIDEVKIYNTALTPEEIKQDYNQGSAIQFGQTTQNIGGTTTSLDYCIPGDTSYCAPPVAEWNFEENTGFTAKDTSGNNNNGTLGAGSSAPTWTVGHNNQGSALSFDGANNRLPLNTPINLNGNANWTVSTWVKTSYSGANPILSNKDGGPVYNDLRVYNSKMSYYHYNGSWINETGNKNIADGKWHHLTWVNHNNQTMDMYVDGVGDTLGVPSALSSNGPVNQIGRDWSVTSIASIDQVRIYSYARTPAQIAYDYNRGGPVGWWKFDECQGSTAFDSSGFNNHGNISIGQSGTQNSIGTCQIGTSAAWTNGASGKINSSINFDGSDDYITINDSPNIRFNTNDFSITAWVKHASNLNSIHRGIFTKGNTSTGGFSLYINYDTRKLRFINQNSITIDSNQIIADNSWHHVVASRNSNDLILYVDGKLDNSSPGYFSDLNLNNSATALIGLRDGNRYFNGQIDDIRIYNYALTDEQVKTVYNNGAVNFN